MRNAKLQCKGNRKDTRQACNSHLLRLRIQHSLLRLHLLLLLQQLRRQRRVRRSDRAHLQE